MFRFKKCPTYKCSDLSNPKLLKQYKRLKTFNVYQRGALYLILKMIRNDTGNGTKDCSSMLDSKTGERHVLAVTAVFLLDGLVNEYLLPHFNKKDIRILMLSCIDLRRELITLPGILWMKNVSYGTKETIYKVPTDLTNFKEVIITATSVSYIWGGLSINKMLRYASHKLGEKDLKEVVLAAVKCKPYFLEYVPEEMKRDKDIVTLAVKTCNIGTTLKHASDEMKGDKEVVIAAAKQHGLALGYASEELRRDKEVVLVAVKQCGLALKYASEELKRDKEVVLTSVGKNGGALRFAPKELNEDKELALVAVKQNGWALMHAPEELKRDKEFILAIVKECGLAMQFASDDLRRDKEVVFAAVKQNGYALQHASEELKGNDEVVLTSMKSSFGGAIKYATPELREKILAWKDYLLNAPNIVDSDS